MNKVNFSKRQSIIVAVITGVVGVVVLGRSFASTPPQFLYVSPSGNDTNAGTVDAPFKTIQKAVNESSVGDTVLVASGLYKETVTIGPKASGVTFKGSGATQPIVDGENKRPVGISLTNGVHNVTIDNFEVRNIASDPTVPGLDKLRAVGISSYNSHDSTIINNHIHDVHTHDNLHSFGIVLGNNGTPGLVHDITVKNNRIHDIGPGGESMGIWLLYSKQMTLDGNEIYLVRKEAIRDWGGKDNRIINNQVYLSFLGIEAQGSVGSLIANNISHDNIWGLNPKHVSETEKLAAWGLTPNSPGLWTKFWHNTTYNNSHADIGLGMNAPNEDFIDVRNNIFASPSDVHLHDFPKIRGSNIIIDGNAYSGDASIYYQNWVSPKLNTLNDLAALKSSTLPEAKGWEAKGQVFTPNFKDPVKGDFSFDTTGLAPGVNLSSPWGTQVGARLATKPSNSFEFYPAKAIDSSPMAFAETRRERGVDGKNDSTWYAPDYNSNGWVTMNLGSKKSINTFILSMYSHKDYRNPKKINIQTSNDNITYSAPVVSAVNPDPYGSPYSYTLSTPITAQYIKFNIVQNFGSLKGIAFSDFQVGLLTPQAVDTSPINAPPTVALTAPGSGFIVDEPATVAVTATAADTDGSIIKVEFFNGAEKLGQATQAPFQFNWLGVTKGDYTITARATDNKGAATTSAPIAIKVNKKDLPPRDTACQKVEDVYCDNKVNFQDLSAVLVKIRSNDPTGDVNKDGKLNFQDFSYVLGRIDRQ